MIYEQGVEKTTIADIARAADVPLGNVHYYFKTKHELVAADAGGQRGPMQLGADAGRRARPPAGRAAQNVEERADRQGPAQVEPGVGLLLTPTSE